MYTIFYDDVCIASSAHPVYAIVSGVLTQKLNSADSFTFSLGFSNPYAGTLELRRGVIRLRQDNTTIFAGDIISRRAKLDHSIEYTCQGCLAWFNDAANSKITIATQSVQQFFSARMARYEEQTTEVSRTLLEGNCTVGGNVSIGHPNEYTSVAQTLSEMLEQRGGMFRPRYDGDEIYVDYLSTGALSGQEIRFGDNLLDLDDYISAEELATVIYPYGVDGLTISAVNPTGLIYVQNDALRSRYGKISRTMYFETENRDELYDFAVNAVNALAVLGQMITLKAIDLSVGSDVPPIQIGDTVHVISPPHGLDSIMQCSAKSTDIVAADKGTITLGTSKPLLSGIVAKEITI